MEFQANFVIFLTLSATLAVYLLLILYVLLSKEKVCSVFFGTVFGFFGFYRKKFTFSPTT